MGKPLGRNLRKPRSKDNKKMDLRDKNSDATNFIVADY